MCMLMTINPNVGHVRTSSESSFVSYAYIHPFTAHDTITIGWKSRDPLFGLLTYGVCVNLLSIELLDDCQMLLAWPEEHLALATASFCHWPFSRALKYCQTITKKNVLSRVLQGTLSRELPSVFCTLSCTSTSHLLFAWKDQKGNKKVLCTMQESA